MQNPDFYRTYQAKNKLRFVTATSLFDGHDASINIMRRLLQARGVEVIHLGHNRTAREVAEAAIQEDVQGIAISSYQGGHMEYFRFVRQLVNESGGEHIKIYGGGGGVITLEEISTLEQEGTAKIYSPEDGQSLGLEGMIGHMIQTADFTIRTQASKNGSASAKLARQITLLENKVHSPEELFTNSKAIKKVPILGVTGTGGAGKSSLLDELLLRFLYDFSEIKIGIICIDPTKKKTGGALLGDRIRINSCANPRIFLRSMASRGSGKELSEMTQQVIRLFQSADFDFIIVETSGIGQGDTGILDVSDLSMYVMTPEYGASTQLEKIDMLDFADLIAVNKYERRQGPDAVHDIEQTIRRNRYKGIPPKNQDYPVFGTIASRYNDDGTSGLYKALVGKLREKDVSLKQELSQARPYRRKSSQRESLIPSDNEHYLAEIAKTVRSYHMKSQQDVKAVEDWESIKKVTGLIASDAENQNTLSQLNKKAELIWDSIPSGLNKKLTEWPNLAKQYQSGTYTYQVRDKKISVDTLYTSLSFQKIPLIALPKFKSKAELAGFLLRENLPGSFPFTAGIFPFRRKGEDPKRQFAGEGGPARTNKRFHYLSKDDDAKRLSTAFDSVTLYGANPDKRPDIYGKVGESGVSIAHLDDMKRLYDGFDLCSASTSVSMTINGPAPIILAMFLNTAIDQQVDLFRKKNAREPSLEEHQDISARTLQVVRGTVQADILKEDQAQNTCIFSTEFALKLMGDIQEYFIENKVRNYYGVSISGYHIAEAGANPISQLAFTLANGFTYVEYYLKRGFPIDLFAPNLSFFFSNGIDPEYAVLGRVARRIWAIALRDRYGANERSQKLKYHIQTSGRSLHAQEMDFNDIRTTLQALLALYDNCNSLHTNAYDEAVTTPTEESVRRAMAIQLIISHEFGPNKCENINQGSFFIEELTELVEEAVLQEFERISARGGVLGAMETQYQRSKIQEESMHYEHLKHTGELPIMGVNTFLSQKVKEHGHERPQTDLIRASYDEKDDQLKRLREFQENTKEGREEALKNLTNAALENRNLFAELMKTVRYCSLGEITEALYQVGGKYRRSM
ncbi:MAG: methylmalonyl-CoA mutase family protein [Oligoflexales bacterium]|nr:methylmalonyl-CoA mutase family protein [Oligoflexales bacterium]